MKGDYRCNKCMHNEFILNNLEKNIYPRCAKCGQKYKLIKHWKYGFGIKQEKQGVKWKE